MDLLVYFPAIIAGIVALPLDEVFKVVVPHAAIKYLLDFILLAAINNHRWWWRVVLTAWNGVREC
jgi:hypothetical protein